MNKTKILLSRDNGGREIRKPVMTVQPMSAVGAQRRVLAQPQVGQ